jgi:hypothetical protein
MRGMAFMSESMVKSNPNNGVNKDENNTTDHNENSASNDEKADIFFPCLENNEKIGFLKSVHQNLENTIALADSKANITLTLQSLFLSIGIGTPLIANVYSHAIPTSDQWIRNSFIGIDIIFSISSFIGLIYILEVYKPRPHNGRKEETSIIKNFIQFVRNKISNKEDDNKSKEDDNKGLIYFNQITNYGNANEYVAKVKEMDTNCAVNELSNEIYALSHIAKAKMDYVDKSIKCLIINIIITIVVVGLGAVILSR